MPFYAYAWVASIFFGLVAIIGKLTSKYAITNPFLFNFLWNLFSLIITAILAIGSGVSLPQAWTNIIFAGLFYSLFGIFYILGLSRLDVSVFSPLFNFRVIIGVLLGAIFLGEKLAFWQVFLVALIFIAGMFVSIDEKLSLKSFFKKNIAIVILATAFYSFGNVFMNKSIAQNGYWTSSLFVAATNQMFLLITIFFFAKDFRQINIKSLGSTLAMSLALAIADLSANKAYAVNVGISSLITALPISMILAFILSFIYPKLLEKHTLKVYAIRFFAAAVMIIAALKLSS